MFITVFVFLSALFLITPLQAGQPVVESYAHVVEPLLASVVSVSSVKTNDDGLLKGMPEETSFDTFLQQFYNAQNPVSSEKEILLGSGFVLDATEGLIVTSAHVADSFPKVSVTFNDGSVRQAEVIGKDDKTDLALLKVPVEKTLTAVKVGDSDLMRVGDVVFAVGNPFGLGNTVTSGIVSARSRNIQVGPYDDFLQTDAAINRGNSGGPLFNVKGEMIGVNTAIFSPSGGSVGIAFAVPSKMLIWVVDNLKRYGEVKRAQLGVKIQTVTPDIARNLGLAETTGALVSEVTAGTPASKADIQVGDVILAFNGIKITQMRLLTQLASQSPVGSEAVLDIYRNGKNLKAKVVLTQLKDVEKTILPITQEDGKALEAPEGLDFFIADLTPAMRQKTRLPKTAKGVLVTAVKAGSVAEKKGLKRGDLLVEIDKIPLFSVKDFEKWDQKRKREGLHSASLIIERAGERYFLMVDCPLEK